MHLANNLAASQQELLLLHVANLLKSGIQKWIDSLFCVTPWCSQAFDKARGFALLFLLQSTCNFSNRVK